GSSVPPRSVGRSSAPSRSGFWRAPSTHREPVSPRLRQRRGGGGHETSPDPKFRGWPAQRRRSIEPLAHRARQIGVASVDGLTWLQKHQVSLLIRDRAVTNPSRDHEQLPRAQYDVIVILQVDAQLTSRNE